MALIDLEIQNLSTRQSDHHLKTEKLLTQQKKKHWLGYQQMLPSGYLT
jgi:hypothetical protein